MSTFLYSIEMGIHEELLLLVTTMLTAISEMDIDLVIQITEKEHLIASSDFTKMVSTDSTQKIEMGIETT
jgi:hypothetical protein